MVNSRTKFAPTKRTPQKRILAQVDSFREVPFLQQLFDSVNDIVLILNKDRQIVFFNKNSTALLNPSSPDLLYGMRPGEALGCIHASETSGGCGTTEFCRVCGAVNAILNSQKGRADARESTISRSNAREVFDLLVKTTPLTLKKEKFTIFTIVDISHEKRRRSLERIFFHDVLNTVTLLQVTSDFAQKMGSYKDSRILKIFSKGVGKLTNEINSQRLLASAENNELTLSPKKLKSQKLIQELVDSYIDMAKEGGITLRADSKNVNVVFISDEKVLMRVLDNMLKNAIEASVSGNAVTIGSEKTKDLISFWVHNESFIPKNAQLRIFQRSFSTKGEGRGLGAYSMKLLSETYLKGKVTFTSSKKDGTVFRATYPIT